MSSKMVAMAYLASKAIEDYKFWSSGPRQEFADNAYNRILQVKQSLLQAIADNLDGAIVKDVEFENASCSYSKLVINVLVSMDGKYKSFKAIVKPAFYGIDTEVKGKIPEAIGNSLYYGVNDFFADTHPEDYFG